MIVRALALALAGAALAAPAATAGPCAGTLTTGTYCTYPERLEVDPDGNGYVGDCFWVGPDTCVPVFAPVPSASSSGPLVERQS